MRKQKQQKQPSRGVFRKFTGEHSCLSAISIKLNINFIEITLRQPFKAFLGKGVPKMCSKFTGEHPCRFAFGILNFLSCRSNVVVIWENFISKYQMIPTVITIYKTTWHICDLQKQPYRGVLGKRCSENMQQTYRRTPMPKCNFNEVALQLYWIRTSAWVFSYKFAAYFQNTLS